MRQGVLQLCVLLSCSAYSSILKMKAVHTSETSVNHGSMRRHILKISTFLMWIPSGVLFAENPGRRSPIPYPAIKSQNEDCEISGYHSIDSEEYSLVSYEFTYVW
jgi:hypothetical protein